MSQSETDSTELLLLLHIWQEAESPPWIWRASVRHVSTDERHVFATPDAALAYIAERSASAQRALRDPDSTCAQ